MNTKEIRQGLNGSGRPIWCVFVMNGDQIVWVHKFETLPEAENWVEFC